MGIEQGRAFDRLFESGQHAGYLEFIDFEESETGKLIQDAADFVRETRRLLEP